MTGPADPLRPASDPIGPQARAPENGAEVGTASILLHASCVSYAGQGLLIVGAAGSGKSALALGLMAHGARLVADDRTLLHRDGDRLVATAPQAISGLIEARGLGILNAETEDRAAVAAVIDLDQPEHERLPPHRVTVLLEREVPLFHGQLSPYLPAALLQYLKGGRNA